VKVAILVCLHTKHPVLHSKRQVLKHTNEAYTTCAKTCLHLCVSAPKHRYIYVSPHPIQSPNTVCARNVSTFLYFTFLYLDLSQNSFAMDFRIDPACHDSVACAPARVGMFMYISLCMTCWKNMHTGKTGVTADRDKIEFGLFNSSSIFNITLRDELFSLPKKNQTCYLVPVSWCLSPESSSLERS